MYDRAAAVQFCDEHEYIATDLYVMCADGKARRMDKPYRVLLPLVRWLKEQGVTAISNDGQTWHPIKEVIAYRRSCARSDRIWQLQF